MLSGGFNVDLRDPLCRTDGCRSTFDNYINAGSDSWHSYTRSVQVRNLLYNEG